MIINAENLIMGRMATHVAKAALKGEKVVVVNCEKAVITGNKAFLFSDYKRKKDMGTYKGPITKRLPEHFVKRAIRGMIPYKLPKGRTAYENIKCFRGIPEKYKDEKLTTIETCNSSKLPNSKYIFVKDVCKNLGAKI